MKKAFALLVCVAFLFGFSACGEPESPDQTNDAADPSEDESNLVVAPEKYLLGEFDDALVAYLNSNGYDRSNFIISPTSVRAALCLATAGAQGNTRTELLRVAGFSGMDALDSWYAGLKGSDGFSVASSVWNDAELMGEFAGSYTSSLQSNYNADAYARKYNEMTQSINDWMSQKTGGRIQSIDENMDGVSSVLVSTVQMDSAWKKAFAGASTREGGFVDENGEEQTVDFMEQTGEYLYAEENGTKILLIPMKGGLSFVCFLGKPADLFDKMTSLKEANVHVVLPKFELESVYDATDLSGFLLARGIREAIDEKTANFYGMCYGANWFVQEIVQKSKISIDEKGIGSAAAAGGSDSADGGQDCKEFIADRPFSFAVFSGLGTNRQHMLFYGQLTNVGK